MKRCDSIHHLDSTSQGAEGHWEGPESPDYLPTHHAHAPPTTHPTHKTGSVHFCSIFYAIFAALQLRSLPPRWQHPTLLWRNA